METLTCDRQKGYLEPAEDFNKYEGILKEYYINVFHNLHKEFTDKPYARYTVTPSFIRDYAFSVERLENKSFIISNCFSENYWNANNKKNVTVETQKTKIEEDLYLQIGKLFHLIAELTKKEERNLRGLDGSTYYFASVDKNGEIKIGKTWSPDNNSLHGRLVNICDKLFLLSRDNNISKLEIEADIDKLIMYIEN